MYALHSGQKTTSVNMIPPDASSDYTFIQTKVGSRSTSRSWYGTEKHKQLGSALLGALSEGAQAPVPHIFPRHPNIGRPR